jgi:hypothetical protein
VIQGSDIFSKLTTTSAISAIVSTRVYPEYVRAADVSYPYVVYKRENISNGQSFTGGTGLSACELVIAAVGSNQQQAEALSNAIESALDGDTSTWGTCTVQGCWLSDDGVNDDIVTEQETEQIIAYVKELRFDIRYNS